MCDIDGCPICNGPGPGNEDNGRCIVCGFTNDGVARSEEELNTLKIAMHCQKCELPKTLCICGMTKC